MPAPETTSLGWGVGAREGGEDVPGKVSHASLHSHLGYCHLRLYSLPRLDQQPSFIGT